ncbi:hypothetical protein [Cytobacillus luteolus]|uniref:hypothetical protein n=1 Tax=Litchfieldia luteola TaxID=682179 RepID=UPI001AEA09F9|nr:hypothetical protein [Cytobacillus luteolus]MBP1944632.1 hypothetical protein [Cytobacillus luteolus]
MFMMNRSMPKEIQVQMMEKYREKISQSYSNKVNQVKKASNKGNNKKIVNSLLSI